jgi:hypothetical protein
VKPTVCSQNQAIQIETFRELVCEPTHSSKCCATDGPRLLVGMPKEVRHFCQARPAQFPLFSHPSRVLASARELLEGRVTATPRFSEHLARVGFKPPSQFLEPRMANPKLICPFTAGGLLAAACVPLEHVSSDHLRFLTAAPGPRPAPPLPCFCKVSHRSFIRRHACLPPPRFSGVASLSPPSSTRF